MNSWNHHQGRLRSEQGCVSLTAVTSCDNGDNLKTHLDSGDTSKDTCSRCCRQTICGGCGR